MIKILLVFSLITVAVSGFAQFSSLIESPLYIKDKRSFYRDIVSTLIMPIEHLDSLLYDEKSHWQQ